MRSVRAEDVSPRTTSPHSEIQLGLVSGNCNPELPSQMTSRERCANFRVTKDSLLPPAQALLEVIKGDLCQQEDTSANSVRRSRTFSCDVNRQKNPCCVPFPAISCSMHVAQSEAGECQQPSCAHLAENRSKRMLSSVGTAARCSTVAEGRFVAGG